ncbi:hypothetical protein J6590_086193 [Homalodisca vitripennis]|nr:hypothetical protein J6590_086193 [Homalodisca vitripennis]
MLSRNQHTMNGDSSKMCRLCLVEAEVMCPIFNSYSKSNPQSVALPQRIMSFAQIKVAENDGLPSSICYQCLAQVDKSYQFKLQCEQSDATLRQNLQEQFEECDGEPGDWEMMKFTPEVIINEGEDNSDEMNEGCPDFSDTLVLLYSVYVQLVSNGQYTWGWIPLRS